MRSFRCSLECFSLQPPAIHPDISDASDDRPLPVYWILPTLFTKFISLKLTLKVKMECLRCRITLNTESPDLQYYRVSELGIELNELIEEQVQGDVNENDIICNICFDMIAHLFEASHDFNISLCVCCTHSLANRQTHILDGLIYNEVATRISPREIPPNGRICHACWVSARRSIVRQAEADLATPEAQQNNHLLQYGNYRRTSNTEACCLVRGCTNRERLSIPPHLRYKLLSEHHLYVSPQSKICQEHLVTYDWSFIDGMSYITLLSQTEIVEMLTLLSDQKLQNELLDFENISNISNETCKYWIGLSKVQFIDLLGQLNLNHLPKHKTIIATVLMKLRTGEPNARLAQLLNTSEPTIRRMLNKGRQHLNENYVPLHLGIGHLNRNDLINRNLLIPQGLFGGQQNNPIVICDGSYIYVQKSSNYLFQKETYSLHKYRNLIKPFMMVAADGHIIDVFGPYAATMSDADIIKRLFQNVENGLRNYFADGDVFILDRGFRDAIEYLTSLNYVIYKPESLDEGEYQLSTIKANKSRFVTLCRWVVEVVNGRFKRDYKLFRNVYFNKAAAHLMDDFRIAAAIINNYHPVLENRPDATMILDRAIQRLNLPNFLGNFIVENNINRRRASFVRIDGDIPHLDIFPRMEMHELILLSLGIYQIKQARSYYGEHIRRNGQFEIEICNIPESENIIPNENEAQQLIRGRIKSRHQSQKIYFTYILIKPSGDTWQTKIVGYYCNSLVGMRTVGCCAHVMTIVWYLGWARYQEIIEAPATFADGILIREDLDED